MFARARSRWRRRRRRALYIPVRFAAMHAYSETVGGKLLLSSNISGGGGREGEAFLSLGWRAQQEQHDCFNWIRGHSSRALAFEYRR